MCGLLLGACADTVDERPQTYVVHPQDTLYSIAWRHDLDYRDLARWNNIDADLRIAVGQVLVLGPGRVVSPERGASHAALTPTPAPGAVAPPTVASGTAAARTHAAPQVDRPRPLPDKLGGAPNSGAATSAALNPPRGPATGPSPPSLPGSGNSASRWVWPTEGIGAPRAVPGGGILLSGRLGQDVRAVGAGRVVYTGSGLRGYGNLIIIKHADSLLSAYAHNRELLVRDGQQVAVGQVIAHMGEGAHQSAVLYFEIRQNGRPIDPLPLLPKIR